MGLFTTKREQELLNKINDLEIALIEKDREVKRYIIDEYQKLEDRSKKYERSILSLDRDVNSLEKKLEQSYEKNNDLYNQIADKNIAIRKYIEENTTIKEENVSLIAANKELSKTQLKADEWAGIINEMDITIAELNKDKGYLTEMITDLKSDLHGEYAKNEKLVQHLIELKQKDPIIVKNEVVNPQVVQPVVLSSKTK